MLWIILTILAALFMSAVYLIDKFAISKEIKDPIMGVVIYGTIAFVFYAALGFFVNVIIALHIILICLVLGAVYCGATYFYYKIMKKEEVSRFVPMFSTMPIFTVLFGYLFLGEVFSRIQYIGIGILILGALFISVNIDKGKLRLSRYILFILIAVIFYSISRIAVKYVSFQMSILPILFWIGIGQGLVTAGIFLFHHPHIRGRAKQGVNHLILSNFLTVAGMFFFLFAISKGPVSLVSSLIEVRLLFVFAGATLLSVFKPKIMKEKITRYVIIQKSIATMLILTGAFLVI